MVNANDWVGFEAGALVVPADVSRLWMCCLVRFVYGWICLWSPIQSPGCGVRLGATVAAEVCGVLVSWLIEMALRCWWIWSPGGFFVGGRG